MKKMAIVIFNVLVTSWALFTVYVLIASAWFSLTMFAISPLLVIGASIVGLQHFMILNFGLSVLLAMAAIILLPALLKGTRAVQRFVSGFFAQMSLIWHS
ncbi:hypothetical protein [Candidatus Enterococcus clewellii]|uniref:Uncharacterized protein n=1 Tax=Candidatus Enterococcus clewellii TaxID=1834193 RepID=A0A242K788_9ENTE|nr:hypothetical protein [Enterococcus sp. 9E7_DIV0242]OTP15973.1 hypothetical protein A5888_002187 [Enterococcus sp. 9E7_DIV0242]